jgi:PKD domain
LKRYPRLRCAFVPGVLALALIGAGCGGEKTKKTSGMLELSANADRFAGPTPLNVKFSAKAKHARGDVHYRWRFDDGTTSEEESPAHAFLRAGYYTVILDARDASGNNTRQSLLLGAWPPGQWAKAQSGPPPTKATAKRIQAIQRARTDARHRALRAQLRREVEQGS